MRCFAVFSLGGLARGVPVVAVAATLERRDVGSGWLAAVAVASLAPYLLCSPVAGAMAGRFEPRRVFAVTGIVRAAIAAGLGVALATAAVPAILVLLLFALVAIGCPGYPALMRVVRDVVPSSGLDRASAAAAGVESAVFWAGPALGGVLLMFGNSVAIVVCTAMSLASCALAGSLPTVRTQACADSAHDAIRDAVNCMLAPAARPAILSVVGVNLLAGLLTALLVRLPAGLDLGGERAYGLLSFVQGCGAFAAFAALAGSVRFARRSLLPLAAASTSVAALGVATELVVALLACTVFGAAILASEAIATSSLGRSLPAPMLAPAIGVLDAWMVGAMVIGAGVAPALVASVGLRPGLVLAGAATALLAIGAARRHSVVGTWEVDGGHAHRLATPRMRSMTMAPSTLSLGGRVGDSAKPLRR
jgi:hypothetical protein